MVEPSLRRRTLSALHCLPHSTTSWVSRMASSIRSGGTIRSFRRLPDALGRRVAEHAHELAVRARDPVLHVEQHDRLGGALEQLVEQRGLHPQGRGGLLLLGFGLPPACVRALARDAQGKVVGRLHEHERFGVVEGVGLGGIDQQGAQAHAFHDQRQRDGGAVAALERVRAPGLEARVRGDALRHLRPAGADRRAGGAAATVVLAPGDPHAAPRSPGRNRTGPPAGPACPRRARRSRPSSGGNLRIARWPRRRAGAARLRWWRWRPPCCRRSGRPARG